MNLHTIIYKLENYEQNLKEVDLAATGIAFQYHHSSLCIVQNSDRNYFIKQFFKILCVYLYKNSTVDNNQFVTVPWLTLSVNALIKTGQSCP